MTLHAVPYARCRGQSESPLTTPLVLPTLTGRHCVLRPWTKCDTPTLAEEFDDDEIFKFDPRRPSARDWISKQHEQAASGKAILKTMACTGPGAMA